MLHGLFHRHSALVKDGVGTFSVCYHRHVIPGRGHICQVSFLPEIPGAWVHLVVDGKDDELGYARMMDIVSEATTPFEAMAILRTNRRF